MDIRKLGSHPLLLLNTSFAVRGAFDAACRVAEFKPNVSFESRTPHTLLALAESGHGIAIVPSVLPDPRSELHQRFDIGVRRRSRYLTIDTGKLTVAPMFAERAVKLLME